jgi:hypothetical protein
MPVIHELQPFIIIPKELHMSNNTPNKKNTQGIRVQTTHPSPLAKPSLECHIVIPTTMLKPSILELILLTLLLFLILIPNLLLQNNTIHTSLEQCTNSRSLALQQPHSIKSHRGRGTGEVGDFFRELDREQWD